MRQLPLADTIFLIDTVPGDSVPYAVEMVKKVFVPVYRDTGSIKWREMEIDTMAILADYFTVNFYDDTLMNDTSAFVRVQAHTLENKLFYDELLFQNKRAKQIITTITPPARERSKWYMGMGVGVLPGKQFLSANLMAEFPSGFAMGAGYDFMGENAIITGYYKIKFRRHRAVDQ